MIWGGGGRGEVVIMKSHHCSWLETWDQSSLYFKTIQDSFKDLLIWFQGCIFCLTCRSQREKKMKVQSWGAAVPTARAAMQKVQGLIPQSLNPSGLFQ